MYKIDCQVALTSTQGHAREPWVTLLPHRFRFADMNPMSGVPYAASVFADLPPFVACEASVVGPEWDALVARGEAGYVVDPSTWFSLAEVHEAAVVRSCLSPPSAVCGDCWGTWVCTDFDGSCTGTRGAVMWCSCVDTLAMRRWASDLHALPRLGVAA